MRFVGIQRWLAVVGFLVLLGLGERLVATALRSVGSTLPGARQIWAPIESWKADGRSEATDAAAFLLLREFRLGRGLAQAQLRILTDAAIVATINGVEVARLPESDTQLIDEITIDGLLKAGTNRLVLEVRSRRASGGLAAGLYHDADQLAVTDESWLASPIASPGLTTGTAVVADLDPAEVLGGIGVGRWRSRTPIRSTDRALPLPLRPAEITNGQRCRRKTSPDYRSSAFDEPNEPTDRGCALISFDPPVLGLLELRFDNRAPRDGMLLRFEDAEGNVEVEPLLAVPGTTRWTDTRARELREILVIGALRVHAAGGRSVAEPTPTPKHEGLFGLGSAKRWVWERVGRSG